MRRGLGGASDSECTQTRIGKKNYWTGAGIWLPATHYRWPYESTILPQLNRPIRHVTRRTSHVTPRTDNHYLCADEDHSQRPGQIHPQIPRQSNQVDLRRRYHQLGSELRSVGGVHVVRAATRVRPPRRLVGLIDLAGLINLVGLDSGRTVRDGRPDHGSKSRDREERPVASDQLSESVVPHSPRQAHQHGHHEHAHPPRIGVDGHAPVSAGVRSFLAEKR
jgi:hypothetical protein